MGKLLLVIVAYLALGFVGSFLWNHVMPVFGVPKLTVIQFTFLALLLRILNPNSTKVE